MSGRLALSIMLGALTYAATRLAAITLPIGALIGLAMDSGPCWPIHFPGTPAHVHPALPWFRRRVISNLACVRLVCGLTICSRLRDVALDIRYDGSRWVVGSRLDVLGSRGDTLTGGLNREWQRRSHDRDDIAYGRPFPPYLSRIVD
jgi:hypothetical protein